MTTRLWTIPESVASTRVNSNSCIGAAVFHNYPRSGGGLCEGGWRMESDLLNLVQNHCGGTSPPTIFLFGSFTKR